MSTRTTRSPVMDSMDLRTFSCTSEATFWMGWPYSMMVYRSTDTSSVPTSTLTPRVMLRFLLMISPRPPAVTMPAMPSISLAAMPEIIAMTSFAYEIVPPSVTTASVWTGRLSFFWAMLTPP